MAVNVYLKAEGVPYENADVAQVLVDEIEIIMKAFRADWLKVRLVLLLHHGL